MIDGMIVTIERLSTESLVKQNTHTPLYGTLLPTLSN